MLTKLITSIHVQDLFGLYTYDLPENGEISNAAILYGDNGVGKSTILRLAFHLLSSANNRGHRTALYNADFKKIEVVLASGIKLSAEFLGDLPRKTLSMKIASQEKVLAIWDFQKQSAPSNYLEQEDFIFEINQSGKILSRRSITKIKSEKDQIPRGEQAYIKVLTEHVPTMFILNADRRLDSDTVSDPSDEMELRRVMRYEEPKRINELVVRSREIALSQALSSASRWLSKKAVLGANQGSMNVHSVYVDVLHHLLAPKTIPNQQITDDTIGALLKRLATIETKTNEHARYELSTQLSTLDFRKALSARAKKKSTLAAELLTPYIKSLEGRLEAVEPIYKIIDRFVNVINGFLGDKSITYTVSQGFCIQNKLGNLLAASQLSSGEQQLLLLFCYVLTARDNPSVFMIDEPEISLNIKWQRQLIQSLLDITAGATIQFVFASHSMELLAQHRSRVIKLVSKK